MKKNKLLIYIFLIFSFSLYAQEPSIENKEPKTFFGKGISEVDKTAKKIANEFKILYEKIVKRFGNKEFKRDKDGRQPKTEKRIVTHDQRPGNYVFTRPIVTTSRSSFYDFDYDLTQRTKKKIEPSIDLKLMYPVITPGMGYISFQVGDFRYSRYLNDIKEDDIKSIKLISIPSDSLQVPDTCVIKKYKIIKNIDRKRHFSFLLDHSGSMGGDRADKLQLAVLKALENDFNNNLPNITYSVHKFDGVVKKLITSKNFNEIKNFLDPQTKLVGFGGATALFTALDSGIDDIIKDNESDSKIVVLFTDGYATADDKSLIPSQVLLKALLNKINVVVIGFGNNIFEKQLKQIALFAGGNFYRIWSENEFEQLYKNILRDVRISYDVQFSPCMFGDNVKIEMEVDGINSPLTNYAYYRSPTDVGNSIAVDIRFESGSSKINLDKYRFEIDQLLKFLNFKSDLDIMIEGHTDKQGPEKYNQKISEKRAESLKKILISKGIDASRISTVGMGENSPAYSYEYGEEKNELNRRIEIKIQ